MTAPSRSLMIATGMILIVAPIIAVGLKMFSFGWFMVMVVFISPLLLIGYGLQVWIAVQFFLARRAPEFPAASLRRGVIAALATSFAMIVLGIFMPDGGDTGWGSTIQVWLGAYTLPDATALHQAIDDPFTYIALVTGVVWAAAYVWLVVEWIIALVARRRLSPSAHAA